MSETLTCPYGHCWRWTQPSVVVESCPTCPVCGAPGIPDRVRDARTPISESLSAAARPVGTAEAAADPSQVTPTVAEFPPFVSALGPRGPHHGGRFSVVREHAQGGLGRVSLARDEDLHRQVALKEIRPELADNAHVRQRFLAEAEITGQLEHPGIVPIYALGQNALGRPYYAMRFVRGRTLAGAISDYHGQPTPLVFRDLLRHFVDVCQAVAYAHSRGVIHRDLKPANVMLGEYGETLVLDWGLAKVVGGGQPDTGGEGMALPSRPAVDEAGSGPTRDGQVLGTAPYMSPEQAAGHSDAVGPPTDVYALGAMLYEILTGRPPYEGHDPFEVLGRMLQGPPPPPSHRRRGVPLALEAVCRKAMDRQPERRYDTAVELARDVERWLADEPVAAYREPWIVRARRWVKRRRTLVSGGAAAVVVALLSLGVATALLARANQDLLAANIRESAATQAALLAAEEAKTQASIAKEQQHRAETSYRLARGAMDEVVQLQSDPHFQQGLLQKFQRTLQQAEAGFYKRFLELRGDDETFQQERATALTRLGELTRQMGFPKEALPHYQDAVGIYAQLAHLKPGELTHQSNLARTYNGLGSLQHALHDLDGAAHSYTQAQATLETAARIYPQVAAVRRELAKTHGLLGLLQRETGTTPALQSFERARMLQEQLVTDHPGTALYQDDLANTCNNLGSLLWRVRDPTAALASYGQAQRLWDQLVAAHPDQPKYQSDLATTYNNIGTVHLEAGERDTALTSLGQALLHQEKLTQAHPLVPQYQNDLARIHHNLGMLHSNSDRPDAARQSYEEARRLREKLVQAVPDVPRYQRDLALTCTNLGALHQYAGRLEDARQTYEQAQEVLERLVQHHSQVSEYRHQLAITCHNLSALQRDTGNPGAALHSAERAWTIQDELARANGTNTWYQAVLGHMSNHLGQLRATSGQPVDARPLHEQARQIFEKLAAAQPRVLDHQVGLGDTYNNLGYLNTFADRPADGLEWFAQAITKLEGVRQRAPKHQEAVRVLGRVYAGQAEALTKLARHAEAAKDWDKAAQLATGSEQTKYRLRRAAALARAGEHAAAASDADALADRLDLKGEVLYSLAGVYATAAAVKDDPALAGRYAGRAVELLGRAHSEGFFKDPANVKRLRDDSDLDPLRPRDEFKLFVRGVEAKGPGLK